MTDRENTLQSFRSFAYKKTRMFIFFNHRTEQDMFEINSSTKKRDNTQVGNF